MALKILTSTQPIQVDRLIVALYGEPGIGKSTLGFSAAKPILFDFDAGAHRAANRKDIVQVRGWADVAAVTPEDLSPFQTVVIDTVGRALDALAVDILRREPKLGFGGALNQKGWGRLKSEFAAWLRGIRESGKDIVLIAHGTEKMDGDEVKARLDISGGTKDEVYKLADAMGRVYMLAGKRTLDFDPTDAAFGKNPAQLQRMAIPKPELEPEFLAGVLSQIKASLNAGSEAQRAEQERLEKLAADYAALDTAEAFTRVVGQLGGKGQHVTEKAMLMKAAEDKGFEYDRQAAQFVQAKKAA